MWSVHVSMAPQHCIARNGRRADWLGAWGYEGLSMLNLSNLGSVYGMKAPVCFIDREGAEVGRFPGDALQKSSQLQ